MSSIALGAGAEKAQGLIFISEAHEKFYYEKLKEVSEYSCAVTPQVRQTGNRLSGLAGTAYASLLA